MTKEECQQIKEWELAVRAVIYCLYDEHEDCVNKLQSVAEEMRLKTNVLK